MKRGTLLVVCIVAACKSKGTATPVEPSSLWALAPPATEAAVVFREGSLAVVVGAIRAALRVDSPLVPQIKAALRELPVDVLDDASLAAAGIDTAPGGAIIVVVGHTMVVPQV